MHDRIVRLLAEGKAVFRQLQRLFAVTEKTLDKPPLVQVRCSCQGMSTLQHGVLFLKESQSPVIFPRFSGHHAKLVKIDVTARLLIQFLMDPTGLVKALKSHERVAVVRPQCIARRP